MPYIGYYSAVEPTSWFRTIIFPDKTSEEEQEFRRYFQRRVLPMAQIAILIAILLLVGLFIASVIWPASPKIPYAFMVVGALNGVGTIIAGGIAARSGVEFVQWGTIFVTFYVYLVFGLRFRQAAFAG